VPFRNREPPRTDLLRRELCKTHFTQLGGRLPEQPAELRDRDAFTLMRVQVLLDPLAERHRRRTTAGQEPGQLVLKRPLRLSPGAEAAHLQSRRAAACDAIPVGPQRLPIRAPRLQLEHLTLLDHLGTSSIDNEIEESHLRPDDDHLSDREGVSMCFDVGWWGDSRGVRLRRPAW
jgi:hypothetical protein